MIRIFDCVIAFFLDYHLIYLFFLIKKFHLICCFFHLILHIQIPLSWQQLNFLYLFLIEIIGGYPIFTRLFFFLKILTIPDCNMILNILLKLIIVTIFESILLLDLLLFLLNTSLRVGIFFFVWKVPGIVHEDLRLMKARGLTLVLLTNLERSLLGFLYCLVPCLKFEVVSFCLFGVFFFNFRCYFGFSIFVFGLLLLLE